MKKIPIRRINTTQQESVIENFRIRSVTDLLSGKDMIQELHRHDFFFVLALKKGAGSHAIDFASHRIVDNSVFFMRPGQIHELKLRKGSTGYLMEFKSDFYFPNDKIPRQLLRNVSSKNLCKINSNRFKKIDMILANIFQECHEKKEEYLEVIKSNMSMFFIELIRERQDPKGKASEAKRYDQQRLEEFMELMERQITEHKQPSHYAKMLNLSLYQLNAITKNTLGKTSSDLINEHIILESKRSLLATSSQVKEIAFQLGYEDVSYFIRFFRKHTGYSPDVFRNNSR
jgi:AraC family transcriptional activator of pobA